MERILVGSGTEGKEQATFARSRLDEIAREGAHRMIDLALRLEVEQYLRALEEAGARDGRGRRAAVRNGTARPRAILLGAGPVEIAAPRVHDRREGKHFESRILPPYMRRSPTLTELLPVLYLRGLSTNDFRPALEALLGEDAAGLSPTSITRLTAVFKEEYEAFRRRDLSGTDYVYVWADGVHFNVRMEDDRLAALVLVGVTPEGRKDLIAIEDGYRESTDSWATLLRDLKRRGMPPPLLAVGDGALGFWKAIRDVYPETREQRCWVHKIANVLDSVPKRVQPQMKADLHDAMNAPDRAAAEKEIDVFEGKWGKFPKATECLTKDRDALLTHFDFPKEHWKHLRTTNPIESAFATVKLRSRASRGAGCRAMALAMGYKLLLMASKTWRRLDAAHLVALVRAGIEFRDGDKVVPMRHVRRAVKRAS